MAEKGKEHAIELPINLKTQARYYADNGAGMCRIFYCSTVKLYTGLTKAFLI